MSFRWCHFTVLAIYNYGSCSIYHYFQPLCTLMKLKSVVVFFKILIINFDEVKYSFYLKSISLFTLKCLTRFTWQKLPLIHKWVKGRRSCQTKTESWQVNNGSTRTSCRLEACFCILYILIYIHILFIHYIYILIYAFSKDGTWVKRSDNELFDVTIWSFDGAEICELVDLYLLDKLSQVTWKWQCGII